jgi:glutaminyl-tRNA synthetase
VKWLGFDWADRLYYASDYFDKLYEYAVELIKKGRAYVCDQSLDEMRQSRGTITEPGKESPFRAGQWKRTWTCSPACAPEIQ